MTIVSSSPGYFGEDPDRPNEWSADVELDLEAIASDGDTIAGLTLRATHVERGVPFALGIELTPGDLVRLAREALWIVGDDLANDS